MVGDCNSFGGRNWRSLVASATRIGRRHEAIGAAVLFGDLPQYLLPGPFVEPDGMHPGIDGIIRRADGLVLLGYGLLVVLIASLSFKKRLD